MLLNHDVPINPWAEAVHGYSRDFLRRHGADPREAHAAFREYAGDRPIVAYNLRFDWHVVLAPEYARLGLPPAGRPGFCALTLARRAVIEADNFKLDTLRYQFRLGSAPAHQALNDVRVVVRLCEEVLGARLTAAGIAGFDAVAAFSRRTPVASCRDLIRRTLGKDF